MFYKTFLVPCLFLFLGVASSNSELEVYFPLFFKLYKNGTVEKLDKAVPKIPASLDPKTGIQSKDTELGARLYAPKAVNQRAPLVIYFHGGGFSVGSPASLWVHRYLNSLVARANVFALSADYRLAPENPLPAAYEDASAVLRWVAKHVVGSGPEPWLKDPRVDFNRVYLAGEGAGANIVHNLAMQSGLEKFPRFNIVGLILIHPYFLLEKPTKSLLAVNEQERNNNTKLWSYVCPSGNGLKDTRVNPILNPSLSILASKKVLVCLAEKDPLIDAERKYGEALRQRGSKKVEFFLTKGKGHVFHMTKPNSKKASEMLDRVTSFMSV
ncbi:hypothetical protein U1Q18_034987 [Sarracenia purpurea var. burkii]